MFRDASGFPLPTRRDIGTRTKLKSSFHCGTRFPLPNLVAIMILILGCSSFVCIAEPAVADGIKDNVGAAVEPHPVGAIPPGGAGAAAAPAASPANLATPPPQNAGAAAAVAKPGDSPEDDAFLQSLSVSQAFVHAFVASISVIIVSELGDKTFFIAAIMAMKHARSTVFAGAIAALGIMTLLSALGGTLGLNVVLIS